MHRAIENPETEALAQHMAGAVSSGDRAAYHFGLARMNMMKPMLWEYIAFFDRMKYLIMVNCELDRALYDKLIRQITKFN